MNVPDGKQALELSLARRMELAEALGALVPVDSVVPTSHVAAWLRGFFDGFHGRINHGYSNRYFIDLWRQGWDHARDPRTEARRLLKEAAERAGLTDKPVCREKLPDLG